MKSRFCTRIAAVMMLAILLSGCAHIPTGMAPSTKPVTLNAKVIGHATGQSMYISLLGILPLGTPDYAAAVNDAMQKVPGGTAMVNVSSYSTLLFLWVLSINTLTVEGDVVKE